MDYGTIAIFTSFIAIAIYVGLAALSLWITYLIIRTAVKNGILLADKQRGYTRQL